MEDNKVLYDPKSSISERMEYWDNEDPVFRTLRKLLKDDLEQFCVTNICIYKELLGCKEWKDAAKYEYEIDSPVLEKIKMLSEYFDVWDYVEDKMYWCRELVWDKYDVINAGTSEQDAVFNFLTGDIFEYFWECIWLYWETGGDHWEINE